MKPRGIWLLPVVGACRIGFDAGEVTPQPADATIDATRSPPPGDAGLCEPVACAAAQGACVAGACELVATSEAVLQCPAGMPCRLICSGDRYCRDGASCAGATWCEVACIGIRACQAGVDCAGTQCEVTCDGEEACEVGIKLSGGTCVSHCCGIQTCAGSNPCATDQICS